MNSSLQFSYSTKFETLKESEYVCLIHSQSRCVDCASSRGTFCRTALISKSTTVGKSVEAIAEPDEERDVVSSQI